MLNPNTRVGGRPKDVYGQPPTSFMAYWTRQKPVATPEEVLEPGFGAIGYVLNRAKAHVFRVKLVPTGPSNEFFWVQLETPHLGPDSLRFALPATMHIHDLKELIAVWELEDAKWMPGAVASPFFPDDWSMPVAYNTSSVSFFALAFDRSVTGGGSLSLVARKGLHAMRRETQCLAGLIAPENLWALVDDLRQQSAFPSLKLPRANPKGPITPEFVRALREVGAAYFRAKLLKPYDGFLHPHIPHASIINLPSTAIPGFNP